MKNTVFKVLGINDDKDFCQCCGKRGLKAVVWIENSETGEIKHFGTTCATKPEKGFNLDSEIKSAKQDWKNKHQGMCREASQLFKAFGGRFIANPANNFSWIACDMGFWAACLQMVKASKI